MERISLSLSLILSLLPSSSLSLSHSAERSLPSAASPANHQNSIPKVYQRNWQLGTQKTESTTPGKKKSSFCLPEIIRTWILTQCTSTSKVPDYQTKKFSVAATWLPFISTHPPTTSHFTPATALHPLPPSAEHHPEDPQLLIRRPTSQPRKKQKMQARIEKDGEFVLGSDF